MKQGKATLPLSLAGVEAEFRLLVGQASVRVKEPELMSFLTGKIQHAQVQKLHPNLAQAGMGETIRVATVKRWAQEFVGQCRDRHG